MKSIIVIIGPTAVGKSSLGVELALKLKGEIISGDSVQVYRKLNIGSAKPTPAEQKGVRHHLIDVLEPDENFTAADFQAKARALISEIQARGHVPIIVGGTGLYIRALLDGFTFPEEGSTAIKQKWLEFARVNGQVALYDKLKECDPLSARKLHPNDKARIIRALEVFEITGKPLSAQRFYEERKYPALDKSILYIGLTAPREIIYQRIDQRCDDMVKYGIVQEVSALLKEGYSPKLKSLQSIGYRHVILYLKGLLTWDEMLRLFKRDTRRFAKRQLTWFRRDPRIKWYDITQNDLDIIVDKILQDYNKACIVS
ncbi:MAG: tRNA (adenosine(37)-N6)-dimethylallyltransferase MiaA [Peptococcaceae bacterium]|nr:tRNA (adenosine(37)-N6)-dimethylallyltransferase MiaA [Peptococcaceae bacterium]